jgi:aspartate kinase
MVVGHIARAVSEGYSPAVVVSAMGRRGAPYASDTLLDLIHAEGEPVEDRDADMIFHTGEIVSVALTSHLLKRNGFKAVGLTSGQARIYSDGRYRRGKIVEIDPSRLLRHIAAGEIPVVTGGQGTTAKNGEVTILGRGSSDTSGVALGAALDAEKVEVYSDVPGVAVADPRIVPEAHFLKEISYQKLYEIGVFGAKVIHPGAILAGHQAGLPIVCRSTFSEDPGTLVTEPVKEPAVVGIPSMAPVDLLVLPETGMEGAFDVRELYDYYAAVTITDESQGRSVVAVSPDWRQALEDDLAIKGIRAERVHPDQGLVSMVGSKEFISESYSSACALVESKGIQPAFRAVNGIRCTFAIPPAQVNAVIRAFHREFCG